MAVTFELTPELTETGYGTCSPIAPLLELELVRALTAISPRQLARAIERRGEPALPS